MRVLILELDGVIAIPRKEGHSFITHVSDVDIPDVVYEKLIYYKKANWLLVVMTNQGLVAEGKRTVDNVWEIFFAVNHLLGGILDGLLICPHDPDAMVEAYRIDCECKKPKMGMFNTFLEQTNHTMDDVTEIMVVGNSNRDFEFAAKLKAIYRNVGDFF